MTTMTAMTAMTAMIDSIRPEDAVVPIMRTPVVPVSEEPGTR